MPSTNTSSSWAKLLAGFPQHTIDSLSQLDLPSPGTASAETKSLWATSTSTHPLVFPSPACWSASNPPSTTKILLATLDLIEKQKTDPATPRVAVFRRAEYDPDIDAREVIAQLCEPNVADPVAMIGYKLDLFAEGALSAPQALKRFVEPYAEDEQQLILTPKYWVSDLHLDSTDGLSVTIGTASKLWVLFPPTPKNLDLMKSVQGQGDKLGRVGPHLEGGMALQTDSAEAIYLPAGTIHGVFTLRGGALAAIDFVTAEAAPAFAALINAGLDVDTKDKGWQPRIWNRFLLSVEVGLDQNPGTQRLALRAWLAAAERIAEWVEQSPEWAQEARGVWRDFFVRAKSELKRVGVCACGEMEEGESLKEHFNSSHALPAVKPVAAAAAKKRKRGAEAETGEEEAVKPKAKKAKAPAATKKSAAKEKKAPTAKPASRKSARK